MLGILVLRRKLGNIASPPEHRGYITVAISLFDDSFQICAHLRIGSKIVFNIGFCGTDRNMKILGERIFTHSVQNAEVDRLCLFTHFNRHIFRRRIEKQTGSGRVNIKAGSECGNHVFIPGNVRKQPQFNL